MKKIKANITKVFIILSIIIILANISAISANEVDDSIPDSDAGQLELSNGSQIVITAKQDLKQVIADSNVNDVIILEPGTYAVNDINITRNVTLQGNGNPRDIILDGGKKSGIILIENESVHARFNNITFINGIRDYGGAISVYSGNVYVDNCIFINNTAVEGTSGGAIANFGIDYYHTRPDIYANLFVNNSLFANNHAAHDGGAITTDFAYVKIYNTVFVSNSAGRDGGAVRVNREGYANVSDCIFMFNYAEEWGGAYYSWVGHSNITRCIFLNNTAGTNGGALMASANINVTDSIIVNNTAGKVGGALYIQQPCNKEIAGFYFNNNLITNNTSPLGKEVFVKWKETKLLFPLLDDNDWGDEDPNDPSIIDPNNVIRANRRHVSSTIVSNLLNELDMGLLDKYGDILGFYIKEGQSKNNKPHVPSGPVNNGASEPASGSNVSSNNPIILNANGTQASQDLSNQNVAIGNSTVGVDASANDAANAYELNSKNSVSKQADTHIEYFLVLCAIVFLAIFVGYRRKGNEE